MDKKDKEVLTTNRSYLKENMSNLDAVIDGLLGKRVLHGNMIQDIQVLVSTNRTGARSLAIGTRALTIGRTDRWVLGKKAERTEYAKIGKLLDILARRGPTAFKEFLEVLVDSGNNFVADYLRPGFFQTSQCLQELPHDWPSPELCLTSGFSIIKSEGPEMERLWKNGSDVYEMKSVPRGRTVIINNENFKNKTKDGKELKLSQRKGTEKDEKGLCSLFEKLDFEVEVHKDQTADEILRILDDEKKNPIHKSADCFVLVILAHGCREGLYGYDGETVSLETIESRINGQSWQQMSAKPKLLFIQACRGKKVDEGTVGEGAAEQPDAEDVQEKMSKLSVNGTVSSSAASDGPRTPTAANILIAQSATLDMVSFRDTELGSWFIQAVVYIFRNFAHSTDINTMLTKVNELVSKGEASGHVTVSEVTTTLTKRFYFFPGLKKQ